MFGPSKKSNIYISISSGYEYTKNAEGKHSMHSSHTWMLTIEPRKHRIPGAPKATEPIHFTARYDETWEEYALQKVGATNLGMAGNILITENAHTTPETITENLRAKLATALNLPSEITTTAGSEHWIRLALHFLMRDEIIESFDVGEFMTFARSYLGNRLDQGSGATAPAVIPYPKLHKGHYKKSKGQGFWLSYPQATSSRYGDRVYGGLM